jgi:hypothetical protein
MLERYCGGRLEVFELLAWYRLRLEHHKPKDLPSGWWHYSRYEDGVPIPRAHRVQWRSRPDLQKIFADPFQITADCYRDWATIHIPL